MILEARVEIVCETCTDEVQKERPWEKVTFTSLSEAIQHWFDTKHIIKIEVDPIDF